MKGERRLVLLPRAGGAGSAGPGPDEPPPSDEEAREARALAEAIERGDDPLAHALKAAARPEGIDEADLDALLTRALGDGEAPPTRIERRGADRLREALSSGEAGDEEAWLAGALRAAWRPAPLPELRNEALLARAFRGRGYRRIAPVTMAALSAVAAIAAGVALIFGQAADREGAIAPSSRSAESTFSRVALIPARSTTDLFDAGTPFPREGGETARMDRIASARAADLRANRYAAWGVR